MQTLVLTCFNLLKESLLMLQLIVVATLVTIPMLTTLYLKMWTVRFLKATKEASLRSAELMMMSAIKEMALLWDSGKTSQSKSTM